MKPAKYHYFVAHTSTFSMGLGVAGAIAIMLHGLHDARALVADFWVWVWIFVAAIPAGLIGLILGVIFVWGFLCRIAARIQGWPFQVGDEVVILTGKHRNTETTVYEIWDSRGQVRVALGEEAKHAVKDVFCAVEVCRRRPPNKQLDRL
jgi:hypothetical protein